MPTIDTVADIASNCLAVRVRMLGRAVSAVYDRALAASGLSVAQMNILVFVGVRGPCAPGEVGRLLHMERSTVSRNLRPLVDAGWLSAEVDESDRYREVRLTPRGRRKLEASHAAWRAAQDEAASMLGIAGAAAVRELGDRMWRDAG